MYDVTNGRKGLIAKKLLRLRCGHFRVGEDPAKPEIRGGSNNAREFRACRGERGGENGRDDKERLELWTGDGWKDGWKGMRLMNGNK